MVLTWTFNVFRPATSCKWSVCGTVTDDSWMRHRSWYVLSAYALPTLGIFALIGLRFASRCILHCNTTAISAYGTHLPTVPTQAYAILCTPAKMPTRALLKTYSDVSKLCIKRSLRQNNVAHVVWLFFPHRRRLRLRLREARAREACEASSRPRRLTLW